MKRFLITLPLLLLPMLASAQVPVVASFGVQAETATSSDIQIFTACSQTSIEIRDSSIGSARTAYNNAMNIALDARKEAEKAAVAILDAGAKKDAIKVAVDEYKKAVTQAQDALTKARKDAWDNFETNTIGCREMNKEPQTPAEASSKKEAAPMMLKADNKASVRTMQTNVLSEQSTEVKADAKSLGTIIKESLFNFFKWNQ